MNSFPMVVADIGGTNARFGAAIEQSDGSIVIEDLKQYACKDFSEFADALDFYLLQHPHLKPRYASIAVAGPISGNMAKMTNLHWEISSVALQQRFNFTRVGLLNDLVAHAMATSQFNDLSLHPLRPGTKDSRGTHGVIGLGTGLGMASLSWVGDHWQAFPSEGGHMRFAPGNVLERAIEDYLKGDSGYLSAEQILSGPGLVNLYTALHALEGKTSPAIDTKAVFLAAKNGEQLARQAINVLIDVLGGIAGDLALTYCATGGVYIGGGVAKHLQPFIANSAFLQRFEETGVRREYLQPIPVYTIQHPCSGLLGAALWFRRSE